MKTVYLEIEVPSSDYCFNGRECCPYFDNEGGHGKCELHIGSIEFKNGYYKKPKECLELTDNVKEKTK
jgi:hypothetical protein